VIYKSKGGGLDKRKQMVFPNNRVKDQLKKEKPKMSNMHTFRKLLAAASEKQEPRMKALLALTKVSPAELVAMTNGLDWQAW
jgi:hypothetical protein